MKAKALFLLFIFMFNTLVGFGCSLFMESDGHQHRHELEHQHVAPMHQHKTNFGAAIKNSTAKIIDKEDSCCKNLVNNFLIQGKLLPDHAKTNLKVSALALVPLIYRSILQEKIFFVGQHHIGQHRYRPPNPDIRISIQSFQI
jgi:hypothetical protein